MGFYLLMNGILTSVTLLWMGDISQSTAELSLFLVTAGCLLLGLVYLLFLVVITCCCARRSRNSGEWEPAKPIESLKHDKKKNTSQVGISLLKENAPAPKVGYQAKTSAVQMSGLPTGVSRSGTLSRPTVSPPLPPAPSQSGGGLSQETKKEDPVKDDDTIQDTVTGNIYDKTPDHLAKEEDHLYMTPSDVTDEIPLSDQGGSTEARDPEGGHQPPPKVSYNPWTKMTTFISNANYNGPPV